MPIQNLWVIMPVYNEQESILMVLMEWRKKLEELRLNYTLCVLNDGSKDNTLSILEGFSNAFPQLKIINKENSGHGQTCVYGYKLALENNADWIFQIDSDGQCDPKFFDELIQQAANHQCVYGVRSTRDDGFKRMVVSLFVTLFTWVATLQFIRDPNTPYRLIHSDIMRKFVYDIPRDFHLANILVSVKSNKLSKIKWIKIHFRDRIGGSASVKTFSFVKHGFKLFKQLRHAQMHQSM